MADELMAATRKGLFSARPDTAGVGTTTGSLWLSLDQGDSWATISRQLPPVYAVRWV